MDQLRAMRVFAKVIDAGSFARAAQLLDIAPGVATRLVSELEEHLGARLINRTTRRLALTDVGETYLERVRGILAGVDDAEAIAGLATAEPRGRLSVLAPASFAVHQLARHLPRFRDRYPRVGVDLTITGSVEVPDENYDVTIIVEQARPIDGAFIARRIAETDVVLCAASRYLDANGRPREPADLVDHEMLLPLGDRRELTLERTAGGAARVAVETRPAPALTVAHVDMAYAAALAGMGIAALPALIVDESLMGQRLERVLPDWRLWALTLFAAMPTRKHLPARTRAFVDFLSTTFGAGVAPAA